MIDFSFLPAKEVITEPLLRWFRITNRDLPWRKTYDPYHVWISEIMLQQTQMDRGVQYFLRWVRRFPDVRSVAEANEQEILKYWEGLGYYARARNLHKAAMVVLNHFGGEVPCDYKLLLNLPGVGPYTAAAVASVAGNQDIPVVDANVTRVYSRLFDIAESVKERQVQSKIAGIAERLLPKGQARSYNQALMDLGGLVCTPKNPLCDQCPIAQSCMALTCHTVKFRPVLAPKKKVIVEERLAALIMYDEKIFIQQRPAKGVWGGLWEFPGGKVEKFEGMSSDSKREIKYLREQLVSLVQKSCGLRIRFEKKLATVTHQYTHHKIKLHSFICSIEGGRTQPKLTEAIDFRWLCPDELSNFAFPAGPRKILERIKRSDFSLLNRSAKT